MRYKEIRLLLEQGDINKIKKMLISRIQTSEEDALLKKLLNVIESSGLDERLVKAISSDPDAQNFGVEKIVADIMNTPGTVAEKTHFANTFKKGFINFKTLLSGKVSNIESLLQNQAKIDPNNEVEQTVPFVTRVFRRMLQADYKKQGEGTGEIALAVLSPRIFKIGGGKEASGDILIRGETDARVEVKARVPNTTGKGAGSPGKFADSKIYQGFDFAGPSKVLKKFFPKLKSRVALVPSGAMRGTTLTVTGTNGLVTKLNPNKIPEFADALATALSSVLGPSFTKKISSSIQTNNSQALQNNFVKMVHDKYYKVKSKNKEEKLDGILIMDIPNNRVLYTQGFNTITNNGGVVPAVYITYKDGGPVTDLRDFAPGVVL
jgi:hypothetical protein|tara:strand:- start:803 stop:1936 length:1134 start_codon:yes stop_codon:yes gene_type:complete